MYSTETKNAVVIDYLHGSLTMRQIAEKHGITEPTIYRWVVESGHQLRNNRGRRKLTEPDEDTQRILCLAKVCTLNAVAKMFGTTKQNIHRIVRRWKDWKGLPKADLWQKFRTSAGCQNFRSA